MAIVRARNGQGRLRDDVLAAYGQRCAVTGAEVEAILEAAHIVPHSLVGTKGMDPRNGVLLRADLHGLFDAHLLGLRLDSAGGPPTVVVADALRETEYGVFHGRQLVLPADPCMLPGMIAVSHRWSISGLGGNRSDLP